MGGDTVRSERPPRQRRRLTANWHVHWLGTSAKPQPLAVAEPVGTSGRSLAFADRPIARWIIRNTRDGDVVASTKINRLGRRMLDIYETIETLCNRGVGIVILEFMNGQTRWFLRAGQAGERPNAWNEVDRKLTPPNWSCSRRQPQPGDRNYAAWAARKAQQAAKLKGLNDQEDDRSTWTAEDWAAWWEAEQSKRVRLRYPGDVASGASGVLTRFVFWRDLYLALGPNKWKTVRPPERSFRSIVWRVGEIAVCFC